MTPPRRRPPAAGDELLGIHVSGTPLGERSPTAPTFPMSTHSVAACRVLDALFERLPRVSRCKPAIEYSFQYPCDTLTACEFRGQGIQDLRQTRLHIRRLSLSLRAGRPHPLACHLNGRGQTDQDTTDQHILIVDDYPDALPSWRCICVRWAIGVDRQRWAAALQSGSFAADLVVLESRTASLSGRCRGGCAPIPTPTASAYRRDWILHRVSWMKPRCRLDRIVVKPCDPDVLVRDRALAAFRRKGSATLPCCCGACHNNG